MKRIFVFGLMCWAFACGTSSGVDGGSGGGGSAIGGGGATGGGAATGGGGSATGGGATGGGAATGGGGGTTGGGAATGGGGAATGGGSATGDAGVDPTYTLAAGDCFFFATATSQDSMSMNCGDMVALGVDISSNSGFCDLPTTYASLSAVPTSYASCSWSSYVEVNLGPDTGHSLIVRDAAMVHHYRMRIVSKTGSLRFSFDRID
ncbi:MAG: hypothetical protein QM817_32040 [Archangium sp.]